MIELRALNCEFLTNSIQLFEVCGYVLFDTCYERGILINEPPPWSALKTINGGTSIL